MIAWFNGLSPIWIALIKVGIIFVGACFFSLVEIVFYKLIVGYRRKKYGDNGHNTFFHALHYPLLFFIWAMGIILALEVLNPLVKNFDMTTALNISAQVITILAVACFVIRYIRILEEKALNPKPGAKKRPDKSAVIAVAKLMRLVVFIIVALMFMNLAGISISVVAAAGGAGALVLGLAAKDTLSNFFGGLMIYTDRPFTIGDWIRSPDRNIEGTVEKINWRLTRIRTFDARPLYVPNSVFSTISVENPSRMTNRRIKAMIGLRYEDISKVASVTEAIKKMLSEHPAIDMSRTCFVRFCEYADSSLNIQVYTFTKTTDWLTFMEVQEDVYLKIADIVLSHGAGFAFPTRTLDFPENFNLSSQQKTGA